MIRLLLSFLIVSTVVYADWTGNWTNGWNTTNVPIATSSCAPDFFSITQNSPEYTVNYNFTTNLKNPSCLIDNVSQQYVSSNLTYNPASNSWFDSFNQSLTFYITNETTTWTLCTGNNSACNISLVFYRVGSDPDQTFLFHSSYGTWLTPTPVNGSNPSTCNPPVNITVKDDGYGYGSNQVTLTSSTGVTSYQAASPLTSSTLSLNWDLQNGMNITYSYNSTLNQTYLQLQMSASCIFSYAKLTDFFSGTYYPDWQNGYASVYNSIQIAIFNNTYMNLTTFSSQFATVTDTLFEYSSGNYMTADVNEFFRYDPVADALFWAGLSEYHFGYMFTKNGSVLPVEPFIGNWSNPQLLNSTDKNLGCCAPSFIVISNATDQEYALDADFHYSEESANSAWCMNNGILPNINSGNALLMEFNVDTPNPYQLFWSGPSGYVISLTSPSDWSQITVTLNGKKGNCSVTMTPSIAPNSSIWMGVSVFSIILSFIVVSGLI